ncbi:MAG: type IV secretion system protein, partial [Candidatus Peregrinibacteria bacterium]|nr:type IV secretion system protein [Candidatus Peregrinibacteria bacterium]
QILSLEKKTFTLASQDSFRPYEEQTIFRFLLLLGTGLAYFLIALIFILRIVILWALLILSPLLLLLAIFRSTRAWFYNWLSLYGRWLLIGPLTALGISLIVNVWQMDGLPITLNQNYESETFTTVRDSNVIFYLPGQDQANTLSSTDEMMEYIIFLLMLYLPVFLGFALTRQKVMNETALAISRKFVRQSSASQSQVIQNSYTLASAPEAEKPAPARGGMVENLRQLVTEKIGFLTNEVMPLNKLKSESAKPTQLMPSASNFLPDKLSSTPIVKMLELLGMEKGSKDSKRKVLREMSQWNNISDIKHQEKVVSVLSEIEARAGLQNAEALAILQEVQSLNTHFEPPTAGHYAGTSSSQGGKAEAGSNVTLHVNEQQHQDDKKVRDRSYNEKAGDKNAKREKDKKNQDGKEKSENETQGPEDEGNTSEKSEPITPNNESDAN